MKKNLFWWISISIVLCGIFSAHEFDGRYGRSINGDGKAYAWEIADFAIRKWYGKDRGDKLPPGNLYSPDNVTLGMKIWNLQTKSLTQFGKTLLSNEVNGIELSPGFRNL